MRIVFEDLNGRLIHLEKSMWIYRQEGGGLEIGKKDYHERHDDIIHVCENDIPEFLEILNKFVLDTGAKNDG